MKSILSTPASIGEDWSARSLDQLPNKQTFIKGHKGAELYLEQKFGIKRSRATLAKYACGKAPAGVTPPRFFKAGRDVLYWPQALDAYAEALIRDPKLPRLEKGRTDRVGDPAAEQDHCSGEIAKD